MKITMQIPYGNLKINYLHMKKVCEQCKEEFESKRNDARFCSSTCKSKYWMGHKNKEAEPKTKENPLQSTLKGVIDENREIEDNNTKQSSPVYHTYKVETKEYRELKDNYNKLQVINNDNEKNILRLQNEIKSLLKENKEIPDLSFAIGCGVIADPSFKKPANNILYAIGGLCLKKMFLDSGNKEEKALKLKKAVDEKTAQIREINVYQTFILSKIERINKQMLSVKQYEMKEGILPDKHKPLTGLEGLSINLSSFIKKEAADNSKAQDKRLLNVYNGSDKPSNVCQTFKQEDNNGKIITSQQLVKYDYKALNFQGKWKDFIGLPSTTFHCAVHGKAGEGKSTFAIQFANYLAENFGKVVYVSGEEGFSKTIKDKFVNNNAFSKNLFIANLRNYDDIIKEISTLDFHFIVIDSLNNMRIDAEKLKLLRERYKNSAMITISQATKEGKMRGSYEIIHDADIEIIVTNGMAETNKNRFKEKHKEFKVF